MWNYGKKSVGSKVFDTFNVIFLIFVSIVTIYPFIFVLFASLSDPVRLVAHRGLLLHPLGFTLNGYSLAFKTNDIINGYGVTAFLVIVGTFCNLVMTMIFAYCISRPGMLWNRFLIIMVIITMYFSGGMIPSFIIVKSLGLYDSLWSLILPNLINTFLLIIMRTAIMAVPPDLEEAARLDGAGELSVLLRVVMPATVPTLAAIGLFYAIGYWNSWSNALIYIKTTTKYPLQMVLRMILVQNNQAGQMANSGVADSQGEAFRRLMKYSTVIISIVPIMMVYPFIQKYFTKGMMIGALKG
jgi:putative aldouronate transport system permease protein